MKTFCSLLLCLVIASPASLAASRSWRQTEKPATPQPAGDGDAPLRYLPRLASRADFDHLSRTYYRGRFYALPHLMFVIDRRDKNRVYYVNSKAYSFHKDFVNAEYLSLERGQLFYVNNYTRADRRFLLGTIAYQTALETYTFEFWEGDKLSADLLNETYEALRSSFFAKLVFKPNSLAQEEAASESRKTGPAGFEVITARELMRDQPYQPLNLGTGIGQLRVVEQVTPDTVIDRNQIVIFKEVPIHLTPLSGLILTEPASPLSHANLLAKSWGIPNARIANADKLFKQLEGKYVRLEVNENEYKLMPANPKEVEARNREWIKRADLVTPAADLQYEKLTDLRAQRARDARRFGAKAANQGEIIQARQPGLAVPNGFSIPFLHYQIFLTVNKLDARISEAVEEDRFVHDAGYRKKRLAEIRQWIQQGEMEVGLKKSLVAKASALGIQNGKIFI